MSEKPIANTIPPTLRELLTKLDFLAMITKGIKPCLTDMTFVDAKSWYGAWKRFVSGENREMMILHIDNIIEQTITAINEYGKTEFLSLIIVKLDKTRIGIENLKSTYIQHPYTISKLNTILGNIQHQLDKNINILHLNNFTRDEKPLPPVPPRQSTNTSSSSGNKQS